MLTAFLLALQLLCGSNADASQVGKRGATLNTSRNAMAAQVARDSYGREAGRDARIQRPGYFTDTAFANVDGSARSHARTCACDSVAEKGIVPTKRTATLTPPATSWCVPPLKRDRRNVPLPGSERLVDLSFSRLAQGALHAAARLGALIDALLPLRHPLHPQRSGAFLRPRGFSWPNGGRPSW